VYGVEKYFLIHSVCPVGKKCFPYSFGKKFPFSQDFFYLKKKKCFRRSEERPRKRRKRRREEGKKKRSSGEKEKRTHLPSDAWHQMETSTGFEFRIQNLWTKCQH
jgi:hypothetical protein